MKAIIKNINELSDSKEMYETKPHPFFAIFISLLMGLVVAGIIWMYYGELDIVSKGRGVIRPNEQLSVIRNKAAGVVTLCELEEGKRVKAGEVLMRIDSADQEVKKLQLQEVVNEQKSMLDNLLALKQSIEKGQNCFTDSQDQAYVQRYIQYQQDYEALEKTKLIESQGEAVDLEQIVLSKQIYQDKIDKAQKDIKELEALKQSVSEEKSVFEDENSIYALEFKEYVYERNALINKLEEAKKIYDLNVELAKENLVAEEELKTSKQQVEELENQLDQLKLTLLKEAEEKLEANSLAKEAATREQNKLIVDAGLLENKAKKRELSLAQYKADQLVGINNQVQELEIKYQSNTRDLESIELAISQCTITASIDGILSITQEINEGDLLSQGTELGKIIPLSDSAYKVEVFVPNNDIAGLKVGQEIEYQFDALPYREYGKLKGHIINISTDASESELLGISGYLVTGTLENTDLYNYKNKPVDLKVGMTCNAYVITEQKKILYYLLEKINLKE